MSRPEGERRSGRAGRRGALQRAVTGRVARLLAGLMRSQQEHRRTQFAALGAPSGRIVFLGDSISEFGLWEQWFPGTPVLNRGIGGEISAQVLGRLDTAITAPVAVFLLIGTNDLTVAVREDQIVANVESILQGIEDRAPGTPVFLQGLMPRTAGFRSEIESLNRRYLELASSVENVRYVDLWPALSDGSGALKHEYTLDRLHLNGAGYRAWVDVLRPLVAQVSATSSTAAA
jgi:lysophospholipase L1-like esterase